MYEETIMMEAGFRWAADGDHPDFTFHVSFENLDAVSVTAESFGDIFGLVMNSISNLPKISIEMKPSLEERDIGRNTRQFRKILLAYSDFEGGFDQRLGSL
jgi:predicted DNA-binding ArsR family transcriptional regulator